MPGAPDGTIQHLAEDATCRVPQNVRNACRLWALANERSILLTDPDVAEDATYRLRQIARDATQHGILRTNAGSAVCTHAESPARGAAVAARVALVLGQRRPDVTHGVQEKHATSSNSSTSPCPTCVFTHAGPDQHYTSTTEARTGRLSSEVYTSASNTSGLCYTCVPPQSDACPPHWVACCPLAS